MLPAGAGSFSAKHPRRDGPSRPPTARSAPPRCADASTRVLQPCLRTGGARAPSGLAGTPAAVPTRGSIPTRAHDLRVRRPTPGRPSVVPDCQRPCRLVGFGGPCSSCGTPAPSATSRPCPNLRTLDHVVAASHAPVDLTPVTRPGTVQWHVSREVRCDAYQLASRLVTCNRL